MYLDKFWQLFVNSLVFILLALEMADRGNEPSAFLRMMLIILIALLLAAFVTYVESKKKSGN